jgi:hypothetical protein
MTLQRQKEIGIIIISILLTAGFLFAFMGIIQTQNLAAWTTWLVVAGLSMLWVSLYLACTIFVTTRSGSSIILACIVPLVMMAIGQLSTYVIVGAVIVFILLLTLQSRLHWEMDTRIKLDFIATFLGSARYMFIILIVALLALILPGMQTALTSNEGQITIPANIVSSILTPFNGVIKGIIPGYTSVTTVDDIIQAQVNQQIKQQGGGLPANFTIPPQEMAQLRDQFGAQFGLKLTGTETIPDIIATMLTNYVRVAVHNNVPAALVLIVLSIFITLRLFIIFLVWPTLALLQLWLFIAIKAGLLARVRTTVEVERFAL